MGIPEATMVRSFLSPAQELRSQQVQTAHKRMKCLEEATAEALKYHDKYLAAVEKVMSCLLDSSDTWEDIRTHLGDPNTRNMEITGPSAGRLAAAYNTWKVSKELRMLRDQLEGLQNMSKIGHKHTKTAKKHVEEMEKAAKRCANVNSAENDARIAQCNGKVKEKLLKKKQTQNALLASLDRKVMNDMTSTGTWWCPKLVSQCDELYDAFVKLGHHTLACFSDGASSVPLQQASPQQGAHSTVPNPSPNTSYVAPPANAGLPGDAGYTGNGSTGGPYNVRTTTPGVPLQFDSVPRTV